MDTYSCSVTADIFTENNPIAALKNGHVKNTRTHNYYYPLVWLAAAFPLEAFDCNNLQNWPTLDG